MFYLLASLAEGLLVKTKSCIHCRTCFFHRCLNIKSEIVTPEEVSKICPILRTDDVVGALYAANDFSACDPSDVCRAMATQAKSNGKSLVQIVTTYALWGEPAA